MAETEHLLIALGAVLVLGTAAQWLAWRIRLPSILLLLAFGVIAGPFTGVIDPDEMLGDLLFPVVSLSVAVILFEGSLSLRLRELQEIGAVLARLLSIGMLVTWVLSAVAAWFLLDFSVFKSILLGAVLVVTGPTVIGPLLRHIRPIGRVGPVARWEGIVIDPIGAVLALLVFEAHLAMSGAGVQHATLQAAMGLGRTILVGGGLGTVSALLVALLLRKNLVPDHLQNPVTLMIVVSAFVASNWLQPESGLLTVTVMGVVLTNLPGVVLQHILEFKENLSVLLISSLFILLAARLDLGALRELGWGGAAFVAVLILVVRPLSVCLSTIGTRLSWQERTFVAWLAPRGIVAAAVSSVFALRLGVHQEVEDVSRGVAAAAIAAEPDGDVQPLANPPGRGLVPATFLVIFGTVVVYGFTASPLARRLGLASLNPQGVLIGGADAVCRAVADALQQAGYAVLLTDTNYWNIRSARMEGLRTAQANILSEQAFDELDMGGLGRFFGMTPNDEVNSLAAMHFARVFGRANVYQLAPPSKGDRKSATAEHLRARYLFGADVTHRDLRERLEKGSVIKATKLTEEFDYTAFLAQYGSSAMPMFISEKGRLTVLTDRDNPAPRPGHTVIALIADEARPASSVGPPPTGS